MDTQQTCNKPDEQLAQKLAPSTRPQDSSLKKRRVKFFSISKKEEKCHSEEEVEVDSVEEEVLEEEEEVLEEEEEVPVILLKALLIQSLVGCCDRFVDFFLKMTIL